MVPDKDLDNGGSGSHANCGHEAQTHHYVGTEIIHGPPKVVRELTSQERDTAISRYKEKKKTRRYLFYFLFSLKMYADCSFK